VRVLSVQQPSAQLLVRGVKRLEARTWEANFPLPVRVAIHASIRVPSKADSWRWFHEREPALAFAEQGWLDRRDITALPRGAIVGTATLTAVHLGADIHSGKTNLFAWNHDTERMEIGDRDPETGALRATEAPGKRKPLGVPLPDEEYAWVFSDPVEFEPITGVEGKQRTWFLEGELEGVIAERERRARKRIWRPARVNESRKAKAVRTWREKWTSMRDRLVDDVEMRAQRRMEIKSLAFPRKVEVRLRDDLKRYVSRNRTEQLGVPDVWVKVEPQFTGMFGGRTLVSADEFDVTIRRRMKQEADVQQAARRRMRRREALHKMIDEAGEDALAREAKRAPLTAKLDKALDKMLEEEAEDLEFERREISPAIERRMERVRLRRMSKSPKDPEFDLSLWTPMIQSLVKLGLTDEQVAGALEWERLKSSLMLEGEGM
jgi:hypothetical protein